MTDPGRTDLKVEIFMQMYKLGATGQVLNPTLGRHGSDPSTISFHISWARLTIIGDFVSLTN